MAHHHHLWNPLGGSKTSSRLFGGRKYLKPWQYIRLNTSTSSSHPFSVCHHFNLFRAAGVARAYPSGHHPEQVANPRSSFFNVGHSVVVPQMNCVCFCKYSWITHSSVMVTLFAFIFSHWTGEMGYGLAVWGIRGCIKMSKSDELGMRMRTRTRRLSICSININKSRHYKLPYNDFKRW